jgi:ribosomal protein S18 acetylase RimI-like enzyme
MDIHHYLRAMAESKPGTIQVADFLVMLDPHDAGPYRNYAVPDVGANPRSEEIATLVEAFSRRQRRPRLEYVTDAAPALEGALLTHGFAVEGRLPLMTISTTALRELAPPSDVEVFLSASSADLFAVAAAQKVAYGELAPPTEHDVRRLQRTLERRGLVVGARSVATSKVVGGGLYSPPHAGAAEIAAIGVLPSHRRRGIAAAICAHLATEAFARGVKLLFLMAAHEAERVYARVGFVTGSWILHISLSSGQ